MKILLVSPSFHVEYGGPAFSVSQLGSALADAGAKVSLWAPDGSASNSRVVPDHKGQLERLSAPLTRDFLASKKFDVIHDNGLWSPYHHHLSRLAASLDVCRVVSTRGMLEPWSLNHKWLRKRVAWYSYQKYDLKTADLIHATSNEEAISVIGLVDRPVVVIPNGTSVPELVGRRQHSPKRTALFLSRIHPKKGIEKLLQAWSRLRPVDWQLRIVGPGESKYRRAMEELTSRLGICDSVTFRGSVEGAEKEREFGRADLFVLPTFSENFGMVVAEALSYCVPVLTTRGTPWAQLEEKQCGWWVEATVGGIEAALENAISLSPVELRQMGERGRQLVISQYSWSTIALRFMEAYGRAGSG